MIFLILDPQSFVRPHLVHGLYHDVLLAGGVILCKDSRLFLINDENLPPPDGETRITLAELVGDLPADEAVAGADHLHQTHAFLLNPCGKAVNLFFTKVRDLLVMPVLDLFGIGHKGILLGVYVLSDLLRLPDVFQILDGHPADLQSLLTEDRIVERGKGTVNDSLYCHIAPGVGERPAYTLTDQGFHLVFGRLAA